MSCYFKLAFFFSIFLIALSACWTARFSPRIERPVTISNPKANFYSPFSQLHQHKQHALKENTGKEKTSNLDNFHAVDWCLNVYLSFFISTVNFENKSRKSAVYIDETLLSALNLKFSSIMFIKTQFVRKLFSKNRIVFLIQ